MNAPDLHTTLRSLDPATPEITAAQRDRAADLLSRIVATDPYAAPAPSAAAPGVAAPARRSRRRGLAVVTATAALAVGAAVVIPELAGSGMAYASWTPTPSAVAKTDLDAATAACRDLLASNQRSGPAFDAEAIPVVLAERRGDIVAVMLHQDGAQTVDASCLSTIEPGSGKVTATAAGGTGGSGEGWIPPAGEIAEGSMTGMNEQAWTVSGTAAPDVEKVTLHLKDVSVTATVTNGRYFAWGPGQAFPDPGATSGPGGAEPLFTYDVTLTDGTVRTDVEPSRPTPTGVTEFEGSNTAGSVPHPS